MDESNNPSEELRDDTINGPAYPGQRAALREWQWRTWKSEQTGENYMTCRIPSHARAVVGNVIALALFVACFTIPGASRAQPANGPVNPPSIHAAPFSVSSPVRPQARTEMYGLSAPKRDTYTATVATREITRPKHTYGFTTKQACLDSLHQDTATLQAIQLHVTQADCTLEQ